jgi:FkbM family methyltransferase
VTIEIRSVDTLYGLMLTIPRDLWVGQSLAQYGQYSVGEQHFFAAASQHGGVAIDVGANLGAHSILMAKFYKHVYAFEPQKLMHMLLRANLANTENTTTYNCMVGKEDGFIQMPSLAMLCDQGYNFGGFGTFCASHLDQDVVEYSPMLVRCLDNVKELWKEDRIALLKVDVENMEFEVLKGAEKLIRKFQPILYVENERREESQELVDYIYSLGYKAYWHTPELFLEENWAGNPKCVWADPTICSFNLICVPEGHWLQIVDTPMCTPDDPFMPKTVQLHVRKEV